MTSTVFGEMAVSNGEIRVGGWALWARHPASSLLGQGLAKAIPKSRTCLSSPKMPQWTQQFLPLWTSRRRHREG